MNLSAHWMNHLIHHVLASWPVVSVTCGDAEVCASAAADMIKARRETQRKDEDTRTLRVSLSVFLKKRFT
jgi:hypothetical protein